MTILIAHRGNISGPVPMLENQIVYLFSAIYQGYDVEADIWYHDHSWWLGHDSPTYNVNINDLENMSAHTWFHAKNAGAYQQLAGMSYNVFSHDQEPYAVTSKGWVWSHNGFINPTGIIVMPSLTTEQHLITNCAGVCHDYLLDVAAIIRNNG